jgi:hypothetical protein
VRPSSSAAIRAKCDRTALNLEPGTSPAPAWTRTHRFDHAPRRSARRASKTERASARAQPARGMTRIGAPPRPGSPDRSRGRGSAGGRHVLCRRIFTQDVRASPLRRVVDVWQPLGRPRRCSASGGNRRAYQSPEIRP